MLYYKVVAKNEFIGISTSLDLCRCKFRAGMPPLMLVCDLTQAQYIACNNDYYHDSWLRPEAEKGLHKSATITEISEDEYNSIYKTLESGDEVKIEDEINPSEEPQEEIKEDDPTLEVIIEKKISELSKTCNSTITAGFDVELSDGKTHHFSLTEQDQLNLITLSTMVASGSTQIPYHADGELCEFYSPEDINTIITAATQFKLYHTTYYNSLKLYVKSLTNVVDVGNCYYGMSVPEDYQSDVMKSLS